MMWPFSRRREPGREAPSGPVLRQTVAVRPWRDVPAMTPSVTPIQLTLAPERFAGGLTSWQPPQPYLAPLGHAVSPDAPSGAVGGLTHTVERGADDSGGPAMVLRQSQPPAPVVQRSFAQPSRPLLGSLPEDPAPGAPPTPDLEVTTDAAAAAPASPAAPAMPLRSVPAVTSAPPLNVSRFTTAGTVDVPTLHLPAAPVEPPTAPAAPTPGAPPGQETAAPLLDGHAVAEPPAADAAAQSTTDADPVVQRSTHDAPAGPALPLATPPSPQTTQVPGHSALPAAPPSLPAPPVPEASQASLVGDQPVAQRRKLGLGEPLHERPGQAPPSAAPQSTTDTPSSVALPLQRRPSGAPSPQPAPPARPAPTLGLGPPLGSSAPGQMAAPHEAAEPSPPATIDSPLPPLPGAAVAPTPPPSPPASSPPAPPPEQVTAEAQAWDPPPAPEPTVQRSPGTDDPGPEASAGSTPPGLPAATTAPLLGTVLPPASGDAPADTAAAGGTSLPLQRSAPNGHPSPAAGPGMPTLSVAGVQRAGPASPATRGTAIQRVVGGGPLTLAGLPAIGGQHQLVAPLLGSPTFGGRVGTVSHPPIVQRASAAAGASAAGPGVVSRPPVGHVPARPFDVPGPVGSTALLAAPALPAVLRESHVSGAAAAITGVQDSPLHTLPVAHAAPTAGPGAAAIQRAVGALPPPALHAAPTPLGVGVWRPAAGDRPSAGAGDARGLSLATTAPPRPAPSVGPLALQRSEPEPATQQEGSLGLQALLDQGGAQPEGPNGVSFPQGLQGRGDGQAPASNDREATGGEEPGGEGGGAGHPRDWDAKTIEELSRRLYAGISRRIKQELRTDRERTGRLMDVRR